MRVCILGAGLSSLTLAKALVNQNIYVDLYTQKKINSLNKYSIGIEIEIGVGKERCTVVTHGKLLECELFVHDRCEM